MAISLRFPFIASSLTALTGAAGRSTDAVVGPQVDFDATFGSFSRSRCLVLSGSACAEPTAASPPLNLRTKAYQPTSTDRCVTSAGMPLTPSSGADEVSDAFGASPRQSRVVVETADVVCVALDADAVALVDVIGDRIDRATNRLQTIRRQHRAVELETASRQS